MRWQDIVYFLAVTVVLRYTVSTLVVDFLDHHLKQWLIKTENDAIYWLHYHNRAMKDGHRPSHPLVCEDGDCKKIL